MSSSQNSSQTPKISSLSSAELTEECEAQSAPNQMDAEDALHAFVNMGAQLGMDNDFLLQLAQHFVQRMKTFEGEVLSALQAQDEEALYLLFHNIKGMSGNLRFMHISELAGNCCTWARQHQIEPIASAFQSIQQHYQIIYTALCKQWPSQFS